MMPIGPAREHAALGVQALHEDLRAAVDRAEHVRLGDLAVLEYELAGVGAAHAQLVELLRGAKPFMPFSTRKAVIAFEPWSFGGRAHVDDRHVRVGAVGDPHLGAVGDPAVALLLGAAGHRAHHIEPAPGSLIASAPTNSPEQSFGRYLRRCASLPLRYRLFTHRLECAP
jgi:hypothetical protein